MNRRAFTKGLGSLLWVPGVFAEELTLTPKQTEGPFYPDKLPLDTDNDLIIVNDSVTPAVGTIAWVSGRLMNARGEPVRNAVVEIWQCDGNGAYLHSKTTNADKRDGNFQGFGRFQTGSTGEYVFRTIKPVPYPGRCPHIHFLVKQGGKKVFTTQCYIKGEPSNEKDGIFKTVTDPKQRDLIAVPFTPVEGSRIGELRARFDLFFGATPES
jgi:protocatechuate 3,4-dioxygenase, beta subunit